jgi:hypothetical protein
MDTGDVFALQVVNLLLLLGVIAYLIARDSGVRALGGIPRGFGRLLVYALVVLTFAAGTGFLVGGIIGAVRNELRATELAPRVELRTATDYIGFGVAFLVCGVTAGVLFLLRRRIGGRGTTEHEDERSKKT